MRLPNPEASRAVLIGTATYKELEPLPAIERNLQSLLALFTSPDLWGLPARNCVLIPEPKSPADVLDTIHQAAAEADDTLLVYYAGHGLLDPHTDDLYLALTESTPDRLYTAVRYEDLRREMIDVAHASAKVVLLDCCYSGRAMLGGMSGSTDIADQARIEGTYLMTASADTVRAQAPVGEEFTAFTGEIVTALGEGLPDGPDLLNVETLYWHVRGQLAAKRRPTPQQRTGNDGGMIVLARNRRGVRSPAHQVTMPPRWARPMAPAGYEALIRQSPRKILDQLAGLDETGRPGLRDQLIAAIAAHRPDQEVAAMIAMLRAHSYDADADLVIDVAGRRPADEVLAVLDALRETGMNADADLLLRACGTGPTEDIGALAEKLQHAGRQADVESLLDAASAAHSTSEEVIALVGTLWSVGLGGEINGFLSRVARELTDVEALTLADALRAAGRDEAAFLLYSGAFTAVATRPADEVAALVRSMRDSGRPDDAQALLDAVENSAPDPAALVGMAVALWSATLDEDTDHLLEAAAARLGADEVATLAEGLREVGHQDASLRVCITAAAAQPVATTALLVDSLRDSGRPIDANRLIDSARAWPMTKVAELVAALELDGKVADADRAMMAADACQAQEMSSLIAELHRHGLHGRADGLVRAAMDREVSAIQDVLQGLRTLGYDDDAGRLLALAGKREWIDVCRLAMGLRRAGHGTDADHLLDMVMQLPAGEICRVVVTMRAEQDDVDAERILAMAALNLAAQDVVRLIEALLSQDPAALDVMWPNLAQRSLKLVIDVISLLAQKSPHVDLGGLVEIICQRPGDDVAAFIGALCGVGNATVVDSVLPVIVHRFTLADCYAIASTINARGMAAAGNRFLGYAAARSSAPEVVSLVKGLRSRRAHGDADLVIDAAAAKGSPGNVFRMVTDFGYVLTMRNRDTRRLLDCFGARRSQQDVEELSRVLRANQYFNESVRLLKAAGLR